MILAFPSVQEQSMDPISPSFLYKECLADYYNRNGWHSIILQGTVDHRGHFIDFYVGWPGWAYDATSFLIPVCTSEDKNLLPNCKKQSREGYSNHHTWWPCVPTVAMGWWKPILTMDIWPVSTSGWTINFPKLKWWSNTVVVDWKEDGDAWCAKGSLC
jgi:hypothetical protein